MINDNNEKEKLINSIIDRYSDFIDKGDFRSVYKMIIKDWDYFRNISWLQKSDKKELIGAFTEFLLNNGIDPLLGMTSIPAGFFYEVDIDTIVVPNNIVDIKDYSFSFSKVKEIVLPRTINEIGEEAFSHCDKLEKITFKGSKEELFDLRINVPKKVELVCLR